MGADGSLILGSHATLASQASQPPEWLVPIAKRRRLDETATANTDAQVIGKHQPNGWLRALIEDQRKQALKREATHHSGGGDTVTPPKSRVATGTGTKTASNSCSLRDRDICFPQNPGKHAEE